MYNKVILIGRLTATPEMVKTASDRSFTRVTVAVNRRYKTQNGEREADFITVVVWGRLAETSFQLLESRAQRAVRENNPDNDLADLVLEEELPF